MKKKKINYDVPFEMPPQPNLFPIVNTSSRFYKNCKRQRKQEAKICQDCPFRNGIEEQENQYG
jgi:hypothetical protein